MIAQAHHIELCLFSLSNTGERIIARPCPAPSGVAPSLLPIQADFPE